MRIYTFYAKPGGAMVADIVSVKEGFCWPAFVFGFLWALYHRLWLWAAGLLALAVAVEWGSLALEVNPVVAAAVSLAIGAIIGFHGNDLRGIDLARKGYAYLGLAAGSDRDAAEQRFFDRLGVRIANKDALAP